MELASLIAVWAAPNTIDALIWAAFGLINLWIWQKNKSLGNMLMLCGAGGIVLGRLVFAFSDFPSQFMALWVPLFGGASILVGFFMLSKPMIEAQMATLKAKMEGLKDATAEKTGGDEKKDDAGSDS